MNLVVDFFRTNDMLSGVVSKLFRCVDFHFFEALINWQKQRCSHIIWYLFLRKINHFNHILLINHFQTLEGQFVTSLISVIVELTSARILCRKLIKQSVVLSNAFCMIVSAFSIALRSHSLSLEVKNDLCATYPLT